MKKENKNVCDYYYTKWNLLFTLPLSRAPKEKEENGERWQKKKKKVQIFTECQWLDRSSHLLMLLLLLLLLFIDVKLSLPSMDIETVSSID